MSENGHSKGRSRWQDQGDPGPRPRHDPRPEQAARRLWRYDQYIENAEKFPELQRFWQESKRWRSRPSSG